ncbi:MAG TPA: ATP-binding protein [Candidatus Anaerostipes avistercoris]|uniref:ATP-binding protein n=1 Tax=Candidatus Anaerostipes avistercoris TaxID=2838462 RepID=A0A9D2PEV0_9FIRM|nr:ATP-binding protein [Candidatus Anaerostipes avistercoris]
MRLKDKRLPVGIESFEEFQRENFYYADKTFFIKELLQNQEEVNLFIRPRCFGKTLNLSMIKCFFEIGCDRTLFNGLKIMQEKELCENYMGQFPVISISLKSVDGLNYEAANAALCNVIGREALRFQFLQKSNRLSEEEKSSYRRLIKIGSDSQAFFDMTDAVLTDSLQILTQLLEKHYNHKVILLIDEYDVPLDKAFQQGYYNEMVSLLRNMLGNVLKTNDALYFAVLTGCLRISKESIFTGLNNLKVHTISDVRYDEYFGFTDADVEEMLKFYDISSHMDVIREWYDGYLFGSVNVYCPWDVINYCDELLANPQTLPKNYWANTSGNAMVRRFIGKADKNTKNEIEKLLDGKIILKAVKEELTYPELDDSIDNLWSVLYATGYLTKRHSDLEDGELVKLAIPNKEIRKLFIDLVKDWFQETTLADTSRINRFCSAFSRGDAALIQDMLNDYLWDSISVRDTAVRKNMKENFYHGMLLGMLNSQENWMTQSNAETGEGYSDISICTPERTGIVIELKYAHNGNLKAACEEALKQIEEQKYAVGLQRQGMKKIMKYGIAFYEKECMVIIA